MTKNIALIKSLPMPLEDTDNQIWHVFSVDNAISSLLRAL